MTVAACGLRMVRVVVVRSIVLLKNESGALPLSTTQKIAVIGEFAEKPRFQGGGSSHINPTRVDVALDAIREVAADVTYARGYVVPEPPAGIGMSGVKAPKPEQSVIDQLRAEAVDAATGADVAVVFLGLPDEDESEGFDREHIDLPDEQLAVLDAVTAVNSNVVVVLSNGGVVALPFAEKVNGILETWLLGQAGGAPMSFVKSQFGCRWMGYPTTRMLSAAVRDFKCLVMLARRSSCCSLSAVDASRQLAWS